VRTQAEEELKPFHPYLLSARTRNFAFKDSYLLAETALKRLVYTAAHNSSEEKRGYLRRGNKPTLTNLDQERFEIVTLELHTRNSNL
jgi:hypothetical protein